jgi:hypothetical protein
MTMSTPSLTDRLLETLPASRPGLFNPWLDWCEADERGHPQAGPAGRRARLAAHLDCEPRYLLIGESPGWRGCRYSGVPFTSERQLIDGSIPRMPPLRQRLTRDSPSGGPLAEPSATIVWNTLRALRIAEHVVLWNALQLHPHRPGTAWSNRRLASAELGLGAPALELLLDTFPDARVIAIGKRSEELLRELDVLPNGLLRHPAYGGAREFAEGLRRLI